MARGEVPQGSVLQLGEYNKLPDIKDAVNFHSVKCRNGTQLYRLFGMRHHDEFTHPDYDKLRSEFSQFEQRTQGTKRIIVTEGSIADSGDDEESSFKNGRAEAAFLAFWAKKYDIPIISAESEPRWDEAKLVERQFVKQDDPEYGKKLVFYYYFARMFTQLARFKETERPKPEDYLNEWVQSFRDSWGWSDFDFSYNNLRTIHDELYEIPFDPTNTDFFLEQTVNYGRRETPIQQVAQAVNKVRDMTLTYTHLELLDPGSSDFFLQNTDDVGKYCIQQAKNKRKEIDRRYGSGKYSIFDSHGYFHTAIVAPALERWGEKDIDGDF
ncbi:MAG TPA: hypothetical protein VLF93_04300 [Candidatus Saccharimonadales bacterium]|nr:hypothetical protein [Candidatus Saccharimonadales bacterium]